MDLTQRKLTKSEWDGIEIPVNKDELEILHLIVNGFSDVGIKVNKTNSIFTSLKIEYNDQIEKFLYAKFFADKVKELVNTYHIPFLHFGTKKTITMKKKDAIIKEAKEKGGGGGGGEGGGGGGEGEGEGGERGEGEGIRGAKESVGDYVHYYIHIDTIIKLKSGDQIRLSRIDTDTIHNETNI